MWHCMGVAKIYVLKPLRIYEIQFIESVGYIILMKLQTINVFLTLWQFYCWLLVCICHVCKQWSNVKKKKKCFSYPLPHFKDGIRNTQNVFNIFILLTLIGKSRDVFCTNYEPIKLRLMSVGSNPTLLFWGSIYHLH